MDLPRYIRVAERANLIEKNDLINQPENSPPLLSKKVVHVLQYFPKKVTEMGIWWNTFYILLFFFVIFREENRIILDIFFLLLGSFKYVLVDGVSSSLWLCVSRFFFCSCIY